MRLFFAFSKAEGVFRPSRPEDEDKCSNDPQSPPKIWRRFFALIKNLRKFFHRTFDTIGLKIHIFGQATDDIWVRTTSPCYQLSLFISQAKIRRNYYAYKKDATVKRFMLVRTLRCGWSMPPRIWESQSNWDVDDRFLK